MEIVPLIMNCFEKENSHLMKSAEVLAENWDVRTCFHSHLNYPLLARKLQKCFLCTQSYSFPLLPEITNRCLRVSVGTNIWNFCGPRCV